MKQSVMFPLIIISALLTFSCKTVDIIVFTKDGCSRCEYTINYFNKNNIRYTSYATESEANAKMMWDYIEQSDPDAENVKMPVIVKEGKVYFSIVNLEDFLKQSAVKN